MKTRRYIYAAAQPPKRPLETVGLDAPEGVSAGPPLTCQLTDRDRVRLSFRARGMTLKKLGALIGSTHAHLSQVFTHKPGRGGHTRRKCFPHLTAEEIRLLGWTTEYDAWLSSTQNNVPNPPLPA